MNVPPSEVHVNVLSVMVDQSVATTSVRLRAEIAEGIAQAITRSPPARLDRRLSVGEWVGQAVAAHLAERGWKWGTICPDDGLDGASRGARLRGGQHGQ